MSSGPLQSSESSELGVEPSLRAWLAGHVAEVDAVVFDVDGVLMKVHQPLPGSTELVRWLRDHGVPFTLLTNDGCHSPEEKTASLRRCGMEFAVEEIVSSGHGLAEVARQRGWCGRLFFVMGVLGRPCYAQAAGLLTTCALDDLDACTGVIVGEKEYDWERAVTGVLNFLISRPQAPLVVPNPDVFFPGQSGSLRLASGAVALFLSELGTQYGREIEPLFLGKPYQPIFETNHRRLEQRLGREIPASRTLMVGDSLAGDIGGGARFGYRTALVLTGLTSVDMVAGSPVQPHVVCAHL